MSPLDTPGTSDNTYRNIVCVDSFDFEILNHAALVGF